MMLDFARRALSAALLIIGMFTPDPANTSAGAAAQQQARNCERIRRHAASRGAGDALPFARTELYFGAAMPDGVVAEEAFREFIDEHVMPLFPQGLTVVKAEGRFRTEQAIVKEPSFVLVLLYPCQELADGSRRIDRIRAIYKGRFAQHSVLRVDATQIVWVSY
jgi:hypothetical protein